MKKTLLTALLAAPLLANAAPNLLFNGSFESGLVGWSAVSSVGTIYPPAVISYGPTSAFGGPVTPDNAMSMSPDAVGGSALYFVDDNATQTVSQNFNVLVAGVYTAGFSAFAPANGHGNPINAAYSVTIDGNPVASSNVGALASASWSALSGNYNLAAGSHSFVISFVTLGGASAKDLVLDRAFVTAVPEPGTYGMMALGLAMLGGMVRLRRRR